jgi:hypothetical protein
MYQKITHSLVINGTEVKDVVLVSQKVRKGTFDSEVVEQPIEEYLSKWRQNADPGDLKIFGYVIKRQEDGVTTREFVPFNGTPERVVLRSEPDYSKVLESIMDKLRAIELRGHKKTQRDQALSELGELEKSL